MQGDGERQAVWVMSKQSQGPVDEGGAGIGQVPRWHSGSVLLGLCLEPENWTSSSGRLEGR